MKSNSVFITEVKNVHGRLVTPIEDYAGSAKPIRFRCSRCHAEWEATPNNVLSKASGCPSCARKLVGQLNKSDQAVFEKQLALANSSIRLVGNFSGTSAHANFQCPHGHTWRASPYRVLNGSGCPTCSPRRRKTLREIEASLSELNVRLLSPYTSTQDRHTYMCCEGHTWTALLSGVLSTGRGCPHCATLRKRKSAGQFSQELILRFGDGVKFEGTYVTRNRCLTFFCPEGHSWETTPNKMLHRVNYCHLCAPTGYSSMSITWLEYMSKKLRLRISHAENGGEYIICGTPVDGYNARYGIVFEFNGDFYHGNPQKYNRNFKLFGAKTAGQAHARTNRKLLTLTNAGYLVVSIWESEYRKDFKAWLDRALSEINHWRAA